MTETRNGRKQGGKAKAKAAAAASPEAKPKTPTKEETTVAVAQVAKAKPKVSGKKRTKKVVPEAPSSPSPQKKKKRKRVHKRKGSVADADADENVVATQQESQDTTTLEAEPKATPPSKKRRVVKEEVLPGPATTPIDPPTPKGKEKAGVTATPKKIKVSVNQGEPVVNVKDPPTPKANSKTKAKLSATPVTKKKTMKQEEPASPPTPKEQPVATKRTRKRKNRSVSIGVQEEEMKTEETQVQVVTTKSSAIDQTPKGRTTRATLAAAAAIAAADDSHDTESIPPASTVKSKKKRKTKAVKTDEPDPEPETKPESKPEKKIRESPVAVRKSPRLAHVGTEPITPVKPVRKIVSLAKVKGTTPKEDTTAERTSTLQSVEAAEELTVSEGDTVTRESVTNVYGEAQTMVEAEENDELGAEAGLDTIAEELVDDENTPGETISNNVEVVNTGKSERADVETMEEVDQIVEHAEPSNSRDEADGGETLTEAMVNDERENRWSHTGATSSLGTVPDDTSYQRAVLEEESHDEHEAPSVTSDIEGKQSVREMTSADGVDADGEEHGHAVDDGPSSRRSAYISEAFTLLAEASHSSDVEDGADAPTETMPDEDYENRWSHAGGASSLGTLPDDSSYQGAVLEEKSDGKHGTPTATSDVEEDEPGIREMTGAESMETDGREPTPLDSQSPSGGATNTAEALTLLVNTASGSPVSESDVEAATDALQSDDRDRRWLPARRTSSLGSAPDDSSYQGAVLDVESNEEMNASAAASEDEHDQHDMGEMISLHVDSANNVEDPETEQAVADDGASSEGSIHGSEAFTLHEEQEGDETEYESLGVSTAYMETERQMTHDDEGEGDLDDDTASTSSTSNSVPPRGPRRPHGSSGDEDGQGEGSGGLNTSFMEDEDDWTDSDEDEDIANRAGTAILDELPGLRSSSTNHGTSSNEVIILSDTESDEDGESSYARVATHDEDNATNLDGHGDDGNNIEQSIDDDQNDREEMESLSGSPHIPPTGPGILTAQSAGVGEQEDTMLQSRAEFSVDRFVSDVHTEHEAAEPEQLSGDEAQTPLIDGEPDEEADMEDDAHDTESAGQTLSLSSREQPSDNESGGTIELDDDDEFRQHDASVQDTRAAEYSTGEDEEQKDTFDEQVQRTLYTHQTAQSTPASDIARQDDGVNERTVRPSTITSNLAADTVATQSEVRAIAYTTTPSKLLIDSVLSASREQILAEITQTAMTTPDKPLMRSADRAWGPSFGLSEPLETISTPADVASQAVASPLSSWFFSRGPANFKKCVRIPTPGSPRQRIGSPRPLKMLRVEASTDGNLKTLDQSESETDRFVQNLVDKSWRSWYSKTKPDQLLDPPLPKEMIKRLGGDAAVALLTHVSVGLSSPQEVLPISDAITIPKKRRDALAQLEASIQEEKKQTKAFDEELLQLLQGKTLSGRELLEEFGPLLPHVSSQR